MFFFGFCLYVQTYRIKKSKKYTTTTIEINTLYKLDIVYINSTFTMKIKYNVCIFLNARVRHVTGNDQDYLRKIPRVVVQKSALL